MEGTERLRDNGRGDRRLNGAAMAAKGQVQRKGVYGHPGNIRSPFCSGTAIPPSDVGALLFYNAVLQATETHRIKRGYELTGRFASSNGPSNPSVIGITTFRADRCARRRDRRRTRRADWAVASGAVIGQRRVRRPRDDAGPAWARGRQIIGLFSA